MIFDISNVEDNDKINWNKMNIKLLSKKKCFILKNLIKK